MSIITDKNFKWIIEKDLVFWFLQEEVTNTGSHFGFPTFNFYQNSLFFLSLISNLKTIN